MHIVLFAGFLGSGKTTVISRLIEVIRRRHAGSMALIENEVGPNGVDDLLLGGFAEVKITSLLGGCACCQITGSLLRAIQTIRKDLSPRWLFVELSGVALLSGIKGQIAGLLQGDDSLTAVTIIDAVRWMRLRRAAPAFMEDQIQDADVILLNKTDVAHETETVRDDVAQVAPKHPILTFSALSGDGEELFEELCTNRKEL